MKYLFLFLLTSYFVSCFGQEVKVYFTNDGRYSSDPKNARGYLLVNKIQPDLGYSFKQYNMQDTILISGSYSDKFLTVANGEFIYYKKSFPQKERIKSISKSNLDTDNFIQTIGYFSNGKREGKWTEYAAKDIKSAEYNYNNDILDGPCKQYFNDYSGYWIEGTMINNLKQGKFYTYNADSLLVSESNYLNNSLVKTETYWIAAKPPEDFFEELEKQLMKYQKILSESLSVPVVKFTVDKTGKILNPKIVKGIKPEIDTALITALLNTKPYYPATYNGVAVQQTLYQFLILFKEKESNDLIKFLSKKLRNQGEKDRSIANH